MKSVAYMSKKEFRLFRQLYDLSVEGLHCISYIKFFKQGQEYIQCERWYIDTINAYQKLAVGNWCKIFGSNSEPTHFSLIMQLEIFNKNFKNICDESELLKEILDKACISLHDFKSYRKTTKEYRDRFMVHRENSPEKINEGDLYHPKFDIAESTFLSLCLIIIDLAKKSPSKNDKSNFKFLYDQVDDKETIIKMIQDSCPNSLKAE